MGNNHWSQTPILFCTIQIWHSQLKHFLINFFFASIWLLVALIRVQLKIKRTTFLYVFECLSDIWTEGKKAKWFEDSQTKSKMSQTTCYFWVDIKSVQNSIIPSCIRIIFHLASGIFSLSLSFFFYSIKNSIITKGNILRLCDTHLQRVSPTYNYAAINFDKYYDFHV